VCSSDLDSLHGVRAELYEQSRLTFAALRGILAADFAGFEAERQRFLHGYPKYGNDCAAVDQLLGDIVGFASQVCAGHRMKPDDSAFVPGAFCWIMHEQLGRQCGATPDGRRAGFPFADGCGPAQGRERLGPTAAILSTTSWDHSPMIGGLAYNMKFNSSLFRAPGGRERLRDLVWSHRPVGPAEAPRRILPFRSRRRPLGLLHGDPGPRGDARVE
jgi:formate C-acetyltransferase